MKKINELIKNNQLQEAIDMITAAVANKEHNSEYPEKLFILAMIWLRRYEQTKPVNNKFYEEARVAFISSENAYKLLNNGESTEKYREFEDHLNRAFSVMNMRTEK